MNEKKSMEFAELFIDYMHAKTSSFSEYLKLMGIMIMSGGRSIWMACAFTQVFRIIMFGLIINYYYNIPTVTMALYAVILSVLVIPVEFLIHWAIIIVVKKKFIFGQHVW
jgi:hypothetical protein